MDVKQTLEQKAAAGKNPPVRLTKSMTIVDMVRALEPEIKESGCREEPTGKIDQKHDHRGHGAGPGAGD